jgi:hypothetical protein
MMHTGLHAIGWGLQRLGFALALILFVPLFAYAIVVAVVVVSQAATAFGQ